jgi:acyl transferase domain-containing protein/NADPH:quinone reductase-like Zn-dependent oxidoreductase/nucleoside-diphosphate-sugar epimerase/acyl carrier protein
MSTPADSAAALRQALVAIRKLRAKLDDTVRARTEPIAVIGLSCRFPGDVNDPAGYWSLLTGQRDAVVEIPPERYDVASVFDADPHAAGKTYSRWAGLMSGVDLFDAEFFGIAPREAEQTDPQQRLLLEGAWTALEHAGIAPTRLKGSATGVFAGVTSSEYAKLHDRVVAPEEISAYSGQGLALNAIAGRVSHFLGLHGPAVTMDTACSSSLVAVDRACRSLRDDECTLAIAAGVNVLASPESLITASRWGMFSPEGRCKSFAADADGFVRGEGCGVVVLKRLSAAVADGDRVLGVILGSAVNHDGHSSGLTVPNGVAQQALLRRALASAGVAPGAVGYIEAHGTGTTLGDPIEAEALGAVMREGRAPNRPLLIGSVKTNMGHLESAAGIAGLIKVLLALEHRELPAQLHFTKPSSRIRWDALELKVVDTLRPWEPINGRRIAGVSAFGFSGTNAHVVVAEAPEPAAAPAEILRPIDVLPLSARTDAARVELARSYAAQLAASPNTWSDVCHTAATGRARFAKQLSVRASDGIAAAVALTAFAEGRESSAVVVSELGPARPRIAFAFTGQGSQYAGMGRELYASSPGVRRIIDASEALLSSRLEMPLGAVMRGEHPDAPRLLTQTRYTQPALYALEYALAMLWRDIGVEPSIVLGHSLGEYVAAAVAGVFSFEDGLRLVADRAALMQQTAPGAMIAVGAGEAEVRALLDGWTDRVSLAGINGPGQVTLAGEPAAIAALAAVCAERGWRTVALPVSHAFHSPLLEPIGAAFEARAAQLTYAPPDRLLISNLTGKPIDAVDGAYWRAHARQPVRFSESIHALDALGCDVLLEIGPKPVLLPLAQQLARSTTPRRKMIATIAGPDREWHWLAGALQALHAAGVAIDWSAWDRDYRRRIVDVPTYPFERRHYWITPSATPATQSAPGQPAASGALHGSRLRSAVPGAQFETQLTTSGATAWLADHRMAGDVILPATAFIEMMLAAGRAFDGRLRSLDDLAILAPLALDPERPRIVQTIVDPIEAGSARVQLFAAGFDTDGDAASTDAQFRLYAQARLSEASGSVHAPVDLGVLDARCPNVVEHDEHYARLAAAGAEFGPAFTGLVRLRTGKQEALATITSTLSPLDPARPHPALLDACLQAAAATLAPSSARYLPVALERFEIVTDRWPATVFAHARLVTDDFVAPQIDFDLYDAAGQPLALLRKLTLKSTTAAQVRRDRDVLYEVQWSPSRSAPESGKRAPAIDGRWIIFADQRGVATQLAEIIARAGGTCKIIDAPADRRIDALPDYVIRGVIDCRGIDAERMDLEVAPGTVLRRLTEFYGATLALVRDLVTCDEPPVLLLVSADSTSIYQRPGSPAHALHAALRKTVAGEHPALACRTIVLDTTGTGAAEQLAGELTRTDEPDVAYLAGERFVPRLVPISRDAQATLDGDRVELRAAASGVIDEIEFATVARRAPEAHEVEIETRATGLNFRDALNALGMLGDASLCMGGECAGVVVRAGEQSGFNPGDAVMAFCPGQSGSFVTVAGRDVAVKPPALSFAEAAGLPIAVMTALFAFERVTVLTGGESVLIHAGAGGVGLAAVRLALAKGAVVYATAGSHEKREYLRALGVELVMDSRAPGFGEELRAHTRGRGVDVVLNSLTGPFITEGFGSLASNGRFIELGKRNVLSADEARALRSDVAYTVFDLGEEAERDRELIPTLLARTGAMVAGGCFPALPVHVEPYANARVAIKGLAHARHIGKHVLLHRAHADEALTVRSDAAYLITGGLGSLGLRCAEWLANRGAKQLVLVGRHERTAADAAIAGLRGRGINVRVALADCTDPAALGALIAELPAGVRLRGVVHCAGELADAMLLQQTPAMFQTAAASKVSGAIALHQACTGHELDLFVLFSSAAVVLGSLGQANYVAANAAMDELARVRRARGLPAVTVRWGPWDGGGMAGDPTVRQRLDDLVALDSVSAFGALETLLTRDVVEATVLDVRSWEDFLARRGDAGRDPFFRDVSVATPVLERAADIAFGATLAGQAPHERRRLLLEHVHQQAAFVLGLRDGERIGEHIALHDRGLDSLMSVELRNALAKSLALKLPPTLALDYPTTSEITDHLLNRLFSRPAPLPTVTDEAAAIGALSEAEAEEQLLRELAGADV